MNKENKLFAIKLIHTFIWVIFVTVIFYVVYSGVTDRLTTYTWIGIGLVIGEGLVLQLFKMSCPLTVMARNYSNSQKDNFDIFLPNWLARYNKLIFTTIFMLGLILVLYRTLTWHFWETKCKAFLRNGQKFILAIAIMEVWKCILHSYTPVVRNNEIQFMGYWWPNTIIDCDLHYNWTISLVQSLVCLSPNFIHP